MQARHFSSRGIELNLARNSRSFLMYYNEKYGITHTSQYRNVRTFYAWL